MSEYLYQGGKNEGKPINPKAVDKYVMSLGFDHHDKRWDNYKDVFLEELSDLLNKDK